MRTNLNTAHPSLRSVVRAALGAGLLVVVAGLTGCNNAASGGLSGAGLGAGAGAIIGSLYGNAGTGAAIGAVAGGLSGAVIGDQNERNARYAGGGGAPYASSGSVYYSQPAYTETQYYYHRPYRPVYSHTTTYYYDRGHYYRGHYNGGHHNRGHRH